MKKMMIFLMCFIFFWSGFASADSRTIQGTYTFPAADGINGQVLKTDGSGALSWDSSGAGSLTGLSDVSSATGSVAEERR